MIDMNKLLEELPSLSPDELRRVRQVIDEHLVESRAAVAVNGSERLQVLSGLRQELALLPVRNPADGFSNRDHDKLVYEGDL